MSPSRSLTTSSWDPADDNYYGDHGRRGQIWKMESNCSIGHTNFILILCDNTMSQTPPSRVGSGYETTCSSRGKGYKPLTLISSP